VSFRGPGLTVGLVAALVALLAVGGGAAVAISERTVGAAPSPQVSLSATTAPSAARPTPEGPSTNLTVQLTPAAQASPRAGELQQLLQGYFDAINQHNYAGWLPLVSSTSAAAQSRSQWLAAYATTVDSDIWMGAIGTDPLQVHVRFTSQQDPDLAPRELPVGCIAWSVVYLIHPENQHLVIGSTAPGSVTMKKC
jgi:hypothetical protein